MGARKFTLGIAQISYFYFIVIGRDRYFSKYDNKCLRMNYG